jgi:hypothetical protein
MRIIKGRCVECGSDLWLDDDAGLSSYLNTNSDSPELCEDCDNAGRSYAYWMELPHA